MAETLKMKLNKYLIMGIVVILVLVIGILLIPRPKEGNEYFTIEPEPWVEKDTFSENPNDYKINIRRASRDKSILFNSQQDYLTENGITSFFWYGYYKGLFFNRFSLDPDFYKVIEDLSNTEISSMAPEYTLMKISPDINPSDDTINGFILGKIENQEFVFYIFVDEDWKNKLKFTNIVWGDDFSNKNSLNIREYDFSNNVNGIYIDKLSENVDWFYSDPRKGGIMVGEVTLNTPHLKPSEINSTFMYIR